MTVSKNSENGDFTRVIIFGILPFFTLFKFLGNLRFYTPPPQKKIDYFNNHF
jgi:hypothetical protein